MRNIRRAHIRHGLAGSGLTALALAVGVTLAPVAFAQDDSADPPTRVGRIAVVEGTVSFHPTQDDPWAAALVNYPVAQAGQLWVEPGGRAEIGLGEARIRIDGGTEVDIVQFDDENVVFSVPQGRADIYLHGRHPEEHYVVETPRGNVEIGEDGHYRIFAGSDADPTRVAAFHGRASIAEPQAQLTINRGEEAVLTPTDPPSFQVSPAAEDGFDHWGEERERRVAEGASFRYVSPDMPGAADLDAYGTWRDSPEYGHVWMPTSVDASWAPYRSGHWASVAPWGWTWVDDAPWGFAPFHYGRWAEIDGRWGWIPGEAVTHPVYAPALVAWVGDPGAVVGVGIGGVSVGWIPLGPREVWVPPYHTSIDYVRHGNMAYVSPAVVNTITVTNITVLHNNTTFVNQHHVTVVPQAAFAGAQPIQHAALPVSAAAFSHPIAAAGAPAKMLPPPGPAAHIASPLHAAPLPPAPKVPLAHPIAPTNNLPKLAPVAAHPGPVVPPPGVPHPGNVAPVPVPGPHAPGIQPGPQVQPHPGLPQAVPTPAAPGPQAQPHPGLPQAAPSAPGPHPLPQAEPHLPTPAPQPQYHAPALPQAQPQVPHPATPTPVPQAQPQVAHPAAPTPQLQYHAPPMPQAQPQVAHPAAPTPQPQYHAPPVPQAQPQVTHPAAPTPQPQPQVHAPPMPQAQPQVAHPAAPPPPQAPHPAAAPPAPQAHPAAPPAPQAHPAAAPKKDEKDEHH